MADYKKSDLDFCLSMNAEDIFLNNFCSENNIVLSLHDRLTFRTVVHSVRIEGKRCD